ncbi:chaperone for protein-folding within the ER, fungal-domain-containing protein [Thermoascus aurantiacus ATCC 26904]
MVVALFLFSFLFLTARAAVDPELTGTWSTKSRKVVTGPDFYDPIKDRFKEPPLTGFAYSFTDDGYYEEAYYRAVSNPKDPSCPQGIMQWQHGRYSKEPNGSLILTPFAVDGRQLVSDPCKGDQSSYTRYNQTEIFERYEVLTDRFHNVRRLNLYAHDGSPLNPMYLIYKPPQMLPTQTLNPTVRKGPTATANAKRDVIIEEAVEPLNKNVFVKLTDPINADRWWWVGVIMTSLGGLALLVS